MSSVKNWKRRAVTGTGQLAKKIIARIESPRLAVAHLVDWILRHHFKCILPEQKIVKLREIMQAWDQGEEFLDHVPYWER